MEEYKMLRDEIMYFMNKDTTLFTYLFTGVTAVLFFAIKEGIPECCLLAFLIIIPICSKFVYHQKQMAKISAYMVQHLEKNLDIKWETNLEQLTELKNNMERDHENESNIQNKNSFKIVKIGKFLECPMMACATVASYVYLVNMKCQEIEKNTVFWIITVSIIILFFLTLIICSSIYKIKDFRKEYNVLWKEFERRQKGNKS